MQSVVYTLRYGVYTNVTIIIIVIINKIKIATAAANNSNNSIHVQYILSPVCLSVGYHLPSVMFVHSTHPVEIFRNVSMPFGTLAIH